MSNQSYLEQVGKLNDTINRLLEEIEHLQQQAQRTVPPFDGRPLVTARRESLGNDDLVTLIEMYDTVNSTVDRFVDMYRTVQQEINHLENPIHRMVLELRYLACCSVSEVAETLGYSVRYVYRLHAQALKAMETQRRDANDSNYQTAAESHIQTD